MDFDYDVFNIIGWCVFLFALYLDVDSSYCGYKTFKNGRGSSGIPVVSLIFYIFIVIIREKPFLYYKFIDILFVIFIHVLFQVIIPLYFRKKFRYLERRAAGEFKKFYNSPDRLQK